ncbi:MAG: iron ABC transporter permease [Desulfobacteraceae bacterium]|nr:iron ABC transporter permease [Desulfobacteraceae bacterium]
MSEHAHAKTESVPCPRARISPARCMTWIGFILLIGFAAFVSSGLGTFKTPYDVILKLWLSPAYPDAAAPVDDTVRYIVLNVRLARICLAFLIGAALGLAGTVYQGVLLNPLADPFTLGISTGAAFGASLAILVGVGSVHFLGVSALPGAAFAGALLALYLVYLLGSVDGRIHVVTIVLAGIIVSTFLSAMISLLKSLNEESVSTIVFWIMGSLSGKSWTHVLLVLPYIAAGAVAICCFTRELDLLSLGDIPAQQLGVNVGKVRFWLLLSASLITAAAVAVSGIIGFVGLVIPHLARLALGPRHRVLIPAAMLSGGLLVLVSDSIARSILPGGAEIPVGVVTAILGGPFFCYLLLRRKQQLRLQ